MKMDILRRYFRLFNKIFVGSFSFKWKLSAQIADLKMREDFLPKVANSLPFWDQ